MFKKQKKNILVLCIVAFLVISLVATVAEMELDIDWIGITSNKEYRQGVSKEPEPCEFDTWAHVIYPGTLHRIDITKPGASSPFMMMFEATNPGWCGEWYPSSIIEYPSLYALREVYPEGFYTFDFHDLGSGLIKSLGFYYSSLPSEPMEPVDFIYPSINNQNGIGINPASTWSLSPGPVDALTIILEDLVYWDFSLSMSATSWTPGFTLSGRECELDISVFNIKGLGPGTASTTTTDYTAGESSRSLKTERLKEINFRTIPTPGAIVLGCIGAGLIACLRRCRIL